MNVWRDVIQNSCWMCEISHMMLLPFWPNKFTKYTENFLLSVLSKALSLKRPNCRFFLLFSTHRSQVKLTSKKTITTTPETMNCWLNASALSNIYAALTHFHSFSQFIFQNTAVVRKCGCGVVQNKSMRFCMSDCGMSEC